MAKTTKQPVKKEKKSVKQSKPVEKKTVKSPKKTPVKKTTVPTVPAPSEEKMQVIEEYQVKPGDTGSPEVQVALLTKRIDKLIGHLKGNPSDKKDKKRYSEIVKKVGLSK